MHIFINNLQKLIKLNMKRFNKITGIILKNIGLDKAVVGITFVDDCGMKPLNKKYRNKDRPTDVLSFYFNKEDVALNQNLLGDVVISVETAIRQAKDLGHSLDDELKILLIHGILHLLDYDHIQKNDAVIMEKRLKGLYELIRDF